MSPSTSSVRSFDVFDTVLTRRVGAPTALVSLLGRRLEEQELIPVRDVVFAETRNSREWQLTQLLGRHATLLEIHEAVADALSVDRAQAATWVEAERQLERELTIPVPGAQRRLDEARREGTVVFVSDTPHSAEFIGELLALQGLSRPGERVFTSSDMGVSKSQGGLFSAVADAFGSDHRFVHSGDNRRSDLAAARVEGWAGTHVPRGQLNRYEELLETHARGTDGLTSWWSGASRLARLEAEERGVASPVASVAAGALAPLTVGFALWVIARARAAGVRRLYYVARDGQSMLQAAEHVVTMLAPELDVRFLYGSRKPWTLGACATSPEILAHWVLARPDYTPRTLLARVDLEPEQVFELTGLPLCAPDQADVALQRQQRVELAQALQTEPLLSLVLANARAAADLSVRYFQQEGLLDDVPSALVDAGWGGWTSYAFDHLVREAGGRQVQHLLMGVRGSTDDLARRETSMVVPWLFDEQRHPASIKRLPMPHTLVEVLCAGTMGRTMGYVEQDGRLTPVLSSPVNEPVVAWGLPEVQRVAARVAELVAPHLRADDVHADTTDAVFDVLNAFWVDPTPAEARAWGSFPWEEEIWPPYVDLAQRMTTRDVVAQLKQGDRRIRRVNSWRAGSAEVSSEPWRTLLRARGWQLDNRDRFRRLPRRLRLEVAKRRR